MRIKSKAKIKGTWLDFEFEGEGSEIEDIPNSVESIRKALLHLAGE